MTKEEFLKAESENKNEIEKLKFQATLLQNKYKEELMERNGYKVGDVLTFEINGRTEKGMVYDVDRWMANDNSFYLRFKKVKKDGTMSLVDNDVMNFKKEFELKQI